MGDEAKGHVLTDEEYTQFLRLQEMFLNQPNDNLQRVMGNEDMQGPTPATMPKVMFTGTNVEEFTSKFVHVSMAYGVYDILYEDYGLQKPAINNPDFRRWSNQDSKAFRLLEKSINPQTWSLLRDGPS